MTQEHEFGELEEEIAQARAKRLGTSVKDAIAAVAREPAFLEAAAGSAARRGITVEEVLNEDLEKLNASSYPGPECLEPFEVERFVRTGDLPVDRLQHAQNCGGCTLLLKGARLEETWLELFLEEVRLRFPVALARQTEKAQGLDAARKVAPARTAVVDDTLREYVGAAALFSNR